MIDKMPFLNQESPSHSMKFLELLSEKEERGDNVGKTAVIIPQIFSETLGAMLGLLGITKA